MLLLNDCITPIWLWQQRPLKLLIKKSLDKVIVMEYTETMMTDTKNIKREVQQALTIVAMAEKNPMDTFTLVFVSPKSLEKIYTILKREVFEPLGLSLPEADGIHFTVRNTKKRRVASFAAKSPYYTQRRNTFGGKNMRITFNFNTFGSWGDVVAVMAHEMIHAHQQKTYRPLVHDWHFQTVGRMVASRLESVFPEVSFKNKTIDLSTINLSVDPRDLV
ncbi:MAG: hypothetical protein N3A54_02260 [Patescibacteria group bacterium]|nr:hypothetical protein [Patescibacteria group bacterium]